MGKHNKLNCMPNKVAKKPKPAPRFIAVLLFGLLLSSLSPFASAETSRAKATPAQSEAAAKPTEPVNNPRSDYWREVNAGKAGRTQIQGSEQGVLMNRSGEDFRQSKLQQRLVYQWALPILLLVIIAFDRIVGPHRLPERSGQKIKRFSNAQRLVHVAAALSFIALLLSGLWLILGRNWLSPLLGSENYAYTASFAKTVHNYVGPVFMVCVVLIGVLFIKGNAFTQHDWQWLKQLGGLFNAHQHPPVAGRYNAGEKLWFWSMVTVGLFGVSVTGLIMDFPNWGATRPQMQWLNSVHVFSALYIGIYGIGHAYLGTRGIEGTFEGIKTGYVDEVWAKTHHSLWLESSLTKKTGNTENNQAPNPCNQNRIKNR